MLVDTLLVFYHSAMDTEEKKVIKCSEECIECCDFCIYCKHADDEHRAPLECNHPSNPRGKDRFFGGGGWCEDFHCFLAKGDPIA
jgi:hypothetical protein